MRDTAAAPYSITKHNHMARTGEGAALIQKGGSTAGRVNGVVPNMNRGPESWVVLLPSCLPFPHKHSPGVGLSLKSYQAGELK